MSVLRFKNTLQAKNHTNTSQGKMNYSLELEIKHNVYELLKPELSRFETDRSTIRLEENKVFIEAKDAVALRASMDSVAQLMKVYEKMRMVK